MKKFLIILLLIICSNTVACSSYETGITKLYFIEKYKVHENGVEVWAITETCEKAGKFIKHENVYSCEEETSRIVSLCCEHGQIIYNEYLYFSKEDFKEYIKERYDIN